MDYIAIGEKIKEYLQLKGVTQGLIDLLATLHCAALEQRKREEKDFFALETTEQKKDISIDNQISEDYRTSHLRGRIMGKNLGD